MGSVGRSITDAKASASLPGVYRSWVVSLAWSLGLLVVAFPQVIFLGGSFAPSNYGRILSTSPNETAVWGYRGGTDWLASDGLRDYGAALWQFEPAVRFMARTLRAGESPWWNPQSASGSVGPETLADLKLSPFVLVVALLGGGPTAYTVVLMVLLLAAGSVLQQFFVTQVGLSRVAAVAGMVFFLLNGFSVVHLISQMAAPYFLLPFVLCAMASFEREGGALRLVGAATAYTAVLLTTFLPVALLVLLFAHGVVLCCSPIGRGRRGALRDVIRVHVAVPVIAACGTAFLILPVVANLLWSGDVGIYRQRGMARVPLANLLTLVSPRHFWNTVREATKPDWLGMKWTLYTGVGALLVAAAALPRRRSVHSRLAAFAFVATVVGVWHQAGVAPILRYVPALGIIDNPYWGGLAAMGMVVLVALSIQALAEGRTRPGILMVATFLLVGMFATYFLLARPEWFRETSGHVGWMALVAALVLAIVACSHKGVLPGRAGATALTFLIAVELLSYLNPVRPLRFDVVAAPRGYIDFLERNVGQHRVLNAGRHTLHPEWGAALGVPQVGTLNIAQSPYYRRFYMDNVDATPDLFLALRWREVPPNLNLTAVDLLSARYLVADATVPTIAETFATGYDVVYEDPEEGVRVYENPNAFPPVYLSPALAADSFDDGMRRSWSMARTLTDDHDFSARVESQEPQLLRAQASARPGTARIVERGHRAVTIDVRTAVPAILVATSSYHPNWRATVDGQPQRVGRVNGAFQGLIVPAGRSMVVMQYVSVPLRVGLTVSVLTAVGLAVVTFFDVRGNSMLARWIRPSASISDW